MVGSCFSPVYFTVAGSTWMVGLLTAFAMMEADTDCGSVSLWLASP